MTDKSVTRVTFNKGISVFKIFIWGGFSSDIQSENLYHWFYRTSHNFIVKRRHNNIKMTSVLFKMAGVNVACFIVILNFFFRWHPKVAKKKNPT